MPKSEIGKELSVSELKPRTVVVLMKPGRPAATMWVIEILPRWVHFRAGEVGVEFIARRTGEGLQQITDEDGLRMEVHEFLGEV